MGMFDKFFGVISPAAAAPILAGFYTVVGLAFMILCFGRYLAIPWAIVCLLLMFTGVYGLYATSKGSTWHHRQFVSASWGFLLMFLCWSIVYIAVEDHHVEKVNNGCDARNGWGIPKCDDRRKLAIKIAIPLVVIGMVFGTYFTLVLNKWVSSIEWEEHLEREKRRGPW
ncbi:hypothetical protein B0O80DRAFT_65766 [Mortierella sp. GBAus27b]|nr:hypothetical protein B0O80DRAFT_65766 [Mortierella sp. GBAus27b]